jgi:peptide/nickel transport system permease protein
MVVGGSPAALHEGPASVDSLRTADEEELWRVPPRGYLASLRLRLRRDWIAMAAAAILVLIAAACFLGAPIASRLLGHGPQQYFAYGASSELKPVSPWTWVPDQPNVDPTPSAHSERTLFILGGDGPLGRDEFLRLLYGGRTALEIALGATFFAISIGMLIGAAAGYFSGIIDTIASRLTEFVAAFPLLLLVIAIGFTVGARLNGVTLGIFPRGVLALIVVISSFTWPYPARIVRAQILDLRDREFVEAARMIGASDWRIIVRHLFPYVLGSLLAYAPLILASNMMLEAALSILNLGLQTDTPDWGNMLAQNWGTLIVNTATDGSDPNQATVWTQALPATALLITVLSFSLVGEALRQAANPGSSPVR